MSGHTPGPWYVSGLDVLSTHQNQGVCEVFGSRENVTSAANRNLIAAAPELLEVLAEVEALTEGAHDYATDTGPSCWIDVHGLVVDIRAAIAKARGEG